MGLRLRSPKFVAAVLVCGCCVCFVWVAVLSGEPRSSSAVRREHREAGNITLGLKYNYLLQFMGYPPLRARSEADKAELQRFFASVRHFAISPRERSVFLELLGHFQAFCRRHDIPFFLFFGGLLGAFRHHGFVPWDDDIDVLVPLSAKPKLQVLLSEDAVLAAAEKEPFVVIVFLRDPMKSLPSYGRSWGWPYIEVHFFERSQGQLFHRVDACGANEVSDVFPLIEVPFENLTLPAPRRMDCLVRQCYADSDSRCCTNSYDHRRDMLTPHGGRCIDCSLLEPVFPFVTSRRRQGHFVSETLRLNGTEFETRRVRKPACELASASAAGA